MLQSATREAIHAIASRAIVAGTYVEEFDLRAHRPGQLVVIETISGLRYVIEVVRPTNPTARAALCENRESFLDFSKEGEKSMGPVLKVGCPISYGDMEIPAIKSIVVPEKEG